MAIQKMIWSRICWGCSRTTPPSRSTRSLQNDAASAADLEDDHWPRKSATIGWSTNCLGAFDHYTSILSLQGHICFISTASPIKTYKQTDPTKPSNQPTNHAQTNLAQTHQPSPISYVVTISLLILLTLLLLVVDGHQPAKQPININQWRWLLSSISAIINCWLYQ